MGCAGGGRGGSQIQNHGSSIDPIPLSGQTLSKVLSGLPTSQFVVDSGGIPSHVENSNHRAGCFVVPIVDGVREAVRQGSMEPEVDRVLPEVMFQASEVGDDTVPEVVTNSGFRGLVKVDGGLDIESGFLKDDDPPGHRFRSLVCNSSTVIELASPEAIRAALCSRMLRCHSGEGQSMPSLAKDTQTLSITLKRSAGDIREISSAANMLRSYATPDRFSSGYFGDKAPEQPKAVAPERGPDQVHVFQSQREEDVVAVHGVAWEGTQGTERTEASVPSVTL